VGYLESVRGVLWARKRQPEEVAYGIALAHERFSPSELLGQATEQVSLGPAVTALVHRYNPVVVAQQLATLEQLYPGRAFLGAGSGEAMNEIPAGMRWPSVSEQLRRTEEALEIIKRLLDGETVTFKGKAFTTDSARLYLRTKRRPPVYLSAFGPEAAEIAGRLADGIWTLADPQKAPSVIASYRRAAD
jgi:coenzyme F420-dependent glucose-6-phosphate dehydrogenase